MDLEKKFRFRKFPIYLTSRQFITEVKTLASTKFPKNEIFNLISQISRAADSVVLNIAEGADRGTDKDFAHFLNLSNTSLNEVVACLDIALDAKYITQEENINLISKAGELANQLTAFRISLLKNPTK